MELDKIYQGDCIDIMSQWPEKSVNTCVTSPPYWGLRDYGVEGQLGLEATPEEYVDKMVAVFREVKRVLRADGTLWLNLGDSYAMSSMRGSAPAKNYTRGEDSTETVRAWDEGIDRKFNSAKASGLKPKDLCGIPWRVAFALQQDGWYLRQDIIWHKPNPMPESVRDRCTKAHEYIFLLSKNKKYYYDADAVREKADTKPHKMGGSQTSQDRNDGDRQDVVIGDGYRNKRSVWTVPTAPYSEAHFATFPPKLIEPCILAGCPEHVCKKCGEPRARITNKERVPTRNVVTSKTHGRDETEYGNKDPERHVTTTKTTGWTDCGCGAGFRPGIVHDPFMGSGTTAMVAYENNRHYVGCELNPEYCKLNRAELAKKKYGLFPDD